jgi:hypothetical protein
MEIYWVYLPEMESKDDMHTGIKSNGGQSLPPRLRPGRIMVLEVRSASSPLAKLEKCDVLKAV